MFKRLLKPFFYIGFMLGMERYEFGVEAPGLGRRGGCQDPHQPAVHA